MTLHTPSFRASRTSQEYDNGDQTPFLKSPRDTFNSPSPSSPTVDAIAEQRSHKLRFRVTLLIALLIVAVDLPSVLAGTSMVRILESIYCHQYYQTADPSKIGQDGKIPEQLCKVEDVQKQLSTLRGWMSFWSHLPGLFLAVPYGMLADKYGRKWLFVMNIVAMQARSVWSYVVCSYPHVFPLKAIWLESILGIFGGGSMVATALIFVTLSDVTPTASMASTFFRLGAANMLCFTVGPPIAAAIMKKDPWIAFTLGLCLQAVAIPISLMMPETLGAKKPGEPEKDSKASSSSESPSSFSFEKSSFNRTRWDRVKSFLDRNAGFLAGDWRILFLLSTYPIRMTMGSLDSQIMQYVPQRYHWSMADTTNLSAVQSGVCMAVLLLFLPGLSNYLLKKRHFSVARKDVVLMRMGFVFDTIGVIMTGLAPVVHIYIAAVILTTFAAGGGSAMRALLTSWVAPNEVARLYTALGLIETVGSMAGGPAISTLYNMGLSAANAAKNDVLLGLPWLLVGSVFSLFATAVCVLRFDAEPRAGSYEKAPTMDEEDVEIVDLGPKRPRFADGLRSAGLRSPGLPLTPRMPMTPSIPMTPTIPLTPPFAGTPRKQGFKHL